MTLNLKLIEPLAIISQLLLIFAYLPLGERFSRYIGVLLVCVF